jgi:hypothetical protein
MCGHGAGLHLGVRLDLHLTCATARAAAETVGDPRAAVVAADDQPLRKLLSACFLRTRCLKAAIVRA